MRCPEFRDGLYKIAGIEPWHVECVDGSCCYTNSDYESCKLYVAEYLANHVTHNRNPLSCSSVRQEEITTLSTDLEDIPWGFLIFTILTKNLFCLNNPVTDDCYHNQKIIIKKLRSQL